MIRSPIGSVAPLESTSCTLCGPGCVTGTVSVSTTRVAFNRRHGVKVLSCKLRVGFVDRFRNRDHVVQGCTRYGTMPLIVLHVGELLKKIGDRKPLKIGRVGLASSVDEVTLSARVVRAFLALDYRSRRRRVQLRKPIDRAGAPIDLSVRVALRAPGNTEQLAIVRFRRLRAHPSGKPNRDSLSLRRLLLDRRPASLLSEHAKKDSGLGCSLPIWRTRRAAISRSLECPFVMDWVIVWELCFTAYQRHLGEMRNILP